MTNNANNLTPTGPGWYYRETEDVTDQIVCVLSTGGGALVFYLVENEFGRKVENDGLWRGPVPMPGEFVLNTERAAYDKGFGDDRKCLCGHPYYRHFDTYDDMYPVGCKYCECTEFNEAPR